MPASSIAIQYQLSPIKITIAWDTWNNANEDMEETNFILQLMVMYISIDFIETSMEVSKKAKNRSTIWSSYLITWHTKINKRKSGLLI